MQSGPGPTGRYRSSMGSVKRRAEGPHPYLFVDIGYPFETSVSDERGKRPRSVPLRWCSGRAGYVDDVEFSPMDASRSDPAYLYEVD